MSSTGSIDRSSEDSRSENGPAKENSISSAPHIEDEVSILDIVLVLLESKSVIAWCILVCTLAGVAYAVSADDEYTASIRVVREAQEGGGVGGLGSVGGLGALRGLGLNIGGAASGLTTEAYPSILNSREVLLAVVHSPFEFENRDQPVTFVEYVDQPPSWPDRIIKYTIGLPGVILESLEEGPPEATTDSVRADRLTKHESEAIELIADMVSTSVDQETGFMTIQTRTGSAQLAADLASSFLVHLTDRIRTIRTEKVREQLQFIETRFSEVEQELKQAEERLATFLERNQNPTTASLRFEQDRLQRQVSFKEQLYSNLQSQVTQTRIDLQRQQPVVTVVEGPVVPLDASAPNRIVIIFFSIVLGLILGVGIAFARMFASSARSREENKAKMERIDSALGEGRVRRVVRRWIRSDEEGA